MRRGMSEDESKRQNCWDGGKFVCDACINASKKYRSSFSDDSFGLNKNPSQYIRFGKIKVVSLIGGE